MTPPLPPERNIGPYYRVLGAVLGVGALGLLGYAVARGQELDWVHLAIAGLFVVGMIALVRPEKFDVVFKAMIAKAPFTKFTGEPPAGGAG